ncbi:DEAD/DEAH box helicase [Thiolinea disciformis]|uniref:DEAD/DEAH box helicase n=1 Tax=Thiolinea disciformis TaxID=125614 RepID=UPI000375ABE8|nr:DEAD/DEAH box helicase [Thiolinea disciformis]
MEKLYLSDTRFDQLAIDKRILSSLQEAGFERCSRIQAETLPLALQGKDVTGQAQTGTGKTGAFLVAAFQRLLTEPLENPEAGSVRCLILAPTRELAIQIARDTEALGKNTGLRSVLVYGGAGYEKQRRQFEEAVDILIGTPGRIIDYWKQGVYHFKQTQVLVLDEADRMFDMGFIQDVRFLLRRLPAPEKRLSMLFSATLSQKVLELAYEHMNAPSSVQVETESVSADNIAEHVYFPANNEKIRLLIGLMRKLQPYRAIIFVNTKHNAEKIDNFLRTNAISAAMISGDVRQNKRERLLKEFGDGKYQALIATDVAARGLHIPDVSHVFNFDLPQLAEDYVHRIGRTARAGASGEAHSFACEDTAFYLPDIEEYTGKAIPVRSIDIELLPELNRPDASQRHDRPPHGRDNRHQGSRQRARTEVQASQRKVQELLPAENATVPATKRPRRRNRKPSQP